MVKDKKNINEYTEAYINYYPLVFSVVYSKIGNKDDANDICQDIFIIFYEKYDEVENVRKWLLGTMRNIVLKFFQNKKQGTVSIDDIFEDISLAYVNGFRDTRIMLNEAFENIESSENEKIMLDLIATHNFTYNNVAKLLGMTKRQVDYQYNVLVKRVIDYLKKKGIMDIGELL